MTIIVTDTGFSADDWPHGFTAPEGLDGAAMARQVALDLPGDADPEPLAPHLARIGLIRIRFAGFSDGRAFTLAQRLRRMGFAGRLRAAGHVLADQYAMARRCGFDEVEISDDMARRQPEGDWIFRSDWRQHDYRARLRA